MMSEGAGIGIMIRGMMMVGEAGIEPARACAQRILSPSCIPIPPLARKYGEPACVDPTHPHFNLQHDAGPFRRYVLLQHTKESEFREIPLPLV
jgi:hypothetical protein